MINQTFNVEATLFSAEHPHISKHTSIFSILVSALIALLGIISLAIAIGMDDSSVTFSMLLLTLGSSLVLVALYRIFWKSSEVVYLPTGSAVLEGSCYIDSCDLDTMGRMIENKEFQLTSGVSFKQTGNGRLDYLISKDHQFAAVQLFRFVPYAYEPASSVYYYTGEDAVSFVRYLYLKNN